MFKKTGGSVNCFDTKWEGKPSREIFPKYIAWMHTVMSGVAKRVNQNVGYVYPGARPGETIGYVYFPDGHYEEVE